MYDLICKVCGSEFQSKWPHATTCPKCQGRPCVICGKPLPKTASYKQQCCSAECSKEYNRRPEVIARREAARQQTLNAKSKGVYKEKEATLHKICEYCGRPFDTTNPLQKYCNRDHFKECEVCGKPYKLINPGVPGHTCSIECQSKFRKQTILNTPKICILCGTEFYSESSTSKYCDGPHWRTCPICGKHFDITRYLKQGSDVPKTCSVECGESMREQTSISRYGVSTPSMTQEAREHARQASLANADRRAATCIARYGVTNPAQNEDVKSKISATVSSRANQEAMKHTMQERYGVDYAMQSRELSRKHSGNQFRQYAADGTRVDSRWEKWFYDYLVRNDIPFEYQIPIEFEYNGKHHTTFIDFKCGDVLFEVKGSHLLEGTYGDKLEVPIEKKLEIYRRNHVVIVTGSEVRYMFDSPSYGLRYLDKNPTPLIGVDINLFGTPQFPYAPDKPPSFYKVSVNGDRSAFDAFYDEKFRWKMMMNRIEYVGGFIGAKQILVAMNVTRQSRQPSWFSEKRAADLMQRFCTQDVIVDPFAGWGTRHDAAVRLGKHYVGCDLNPELVQWHRAKGRNVNICDAATFRYEDNCSVFMCPPYADPSTHRPIEDYNYDAFTDEYKTRSECEWLNIVMNNVPNAHEYVMVCKTVSDEFKPYVVDTITNRSHFGIGCEYVVCVPNMRK